MAQLKCDMAQLGKIKRKGAAASLNHQNTRVCFFGHMHVPAAFVRDTVVRGGTYPNEDQSEITLEHVLPENPGKAWNIKPEISAAYYKRLGNLVLLKATPNSTIGNEPFSSKRDELAKSAYKLTEVVGKLGAWGTDEIESRQKKLADIAVKTWPLSA